MVFGSAVSTERAIAALPPAEQAARRAAVLGATTRVNVAELHATAKQRLDDMLEQTLSAPVHDADLTEALKLVNKAHREELDRVQRMLSSDSTLEMSDRKDENFELADIVFMVDNLPQAIAFANVRH